MLKKIVISPDNKRAISFFEELAKRKADLQEKLEKKFSFKPSTKSSTKKETK